MRIFNDINRIVEEVVGFERKHGSKATRTEQTRRTEWKWMNAECLERKRMQDRCRWTKERKQYPIDILMIYKRSEGGSEEGRPTNPNLHILVFAGPYKNPTWCLHFSKMERKSLPHLGLMKTQQLWPHFISKLHIIFAIGMRICWPRRIFWIRSPNQFRHKIEVLIRARIHLFYIYSPLVRNTKFKDRNESSEKLRDESFMACDLHFDYS